VKFYGIVGYDPESNRLELGGNPNLDADPGILWMHFTSAILALVKTPHRRVSATVTKYAG